VITIEGILGKKKSDIVILIDGVPELKNFETLGGQLRKLKLWGGGV
jgi:hypothetical protein